LVIAALLEFSGDALIRVGLKGRGLAFVVLGMLVLGFYGTAVNLVPWNFSVLLGAYVAVFATVSIVLGAWVFHEPVAPAVWFGLALIVAGGLVIQWSASR
jgi:hypothetical protein